MSTKTKTLVHDYEMMYILSPELGDEGYAGGVEKVNSYITRFGGEVKETNQGAPWGKRRLAYPINKLNEGYYAVVTYNLPTEGALELEREMRLNENILRHLVISLSK